MKKGDSDKIAGFIVKVGDSLFSKEMILYLIMGGLTTLVNWATHAILVGPISSQIENQDLALGVTTFIAVVVSVLFAFFTNKIFVFESKSWEAKVFWREFISFMLARAFTGVLEIVGVPLLVKLGLNQKIFGIEAMWAKIVIAIIVVITNYIFSKLIIFTKKETR